MDTLHLVPATLLAVLGFWLLWPVIVDPITRVFRAWRLSKFEQTDAVAESLFQNWSDQVESVRGRVISRL